MTAFCPMQLKAVAQNLIVNQSGSRQTQTIPTVLLFDFWLMAPKPPTSMNMSAQFTCLMATTRKQFLSLGNAGQRKKKLATN